MNDKLRASLRMDMYRECSKELSQTKAELAKWKAVANGLYASVACRASCAEGHYPSSPCDCATGEACEALTKEENKT